MKASHRAEIGVGQDVAVEDEHGPVREIGRVADTAAGAERLGLDHVAQPDAEGPAIAQRLLHVVDAIRAGQDDVGHAVLTQQRELPGEEGLIQQGHDRLRTRERQRSQARALTAGEDDGLRGVA